MTSPLEAQLGTAYRIGGRSASAAIADLPPRALVLIASPGGASFLSTKEVVEGHVRNGDFQRGYRGAHLYRGPTGEGLPIDPVAAVRSFAEVVGNFGGKLLAGFGKAFVAASSNDFAAALQNKATDILKTLVDRHLVGNLPRLVMEAERLYLGLPNWANTHAIRAWDGGGFVDSSIQQLDAAFVRPSLWVFPGLNPEPTDNFGPLLAKVGEQHGLPLAFVTPVLSLSPKERATRLYQRLGHTRTAEIFLSKRLLGFSTGGLVLEELWKLVEQGLKSEQLAHGPIFVHTPFRGSPLFAGEAHEGLSAWIGGLAGKGKDLVAALSALGLLGTPVTLPTLSTLGAVPLFASILVHVLKHMTAENVLPGVAALRPPAEGNGTVNISGIRPKHVSVVAPIGSRGGAMKAAGAAIDDLFGEEHDLVASLSSMKLLDGGFKRLAESTQGHLGVLSEPKVVQAVGDLLSKPADLPNRPWSEGTLECIARARGWKEASSLDTWTRLGLPIPSSSVAGDPLFHQPPSRSEDQKSTHGLPPWAITYVDAWDHCHDPSTLPLEVNLTWCGIAGSRSPFLVVPTDPDAPLRGLQGLCGVVVSELDRANLRGGSNTLIQGNESFLIYQEQVRVVLIPVEHGGRLFIDEWRHRVSSAVETLMREPSQRSGQRGGEKWAISVFLPDPTPAAPTRALAVATMEAHLEARSRVLERLRPKWELGQASDEIERALRPLRLAITWEEDHEACAEAISRFSSLTRMNRPPPVVLAGGIGQRFAGDGYGKSRPTRLLPPDPPWRLRVRVEAASLWKFELSGPDGVEEAEMVVPEALLADTKDARARGDHVRLSELAIFPPELRPRLIGALNLELVLDPEVQDLPWEALHVDGAPLCLRGSVVRRSPGPPRTYPRQEHRALALGNLTGDLPGSVQELQEVSGQIAHIFQASAQTQGPSNESPWAKDAPVILRFSESGIASETGGDAGALKHLLLNHRHRAVHIATHGYAGAVILGLGPQDRLTADDIRKARHVPEFVVLNCCHMESSVPGEDSLPRVLRERGAVAVVSTGWEVPDDIAREFAKCLWNELAAGMSLGEATHRARLKARSMSGDFRDWCSWQIWGDAGWVLSAGSVGEPRWNGNIEDLRTPAQIIQALYTMQGVLRNSPYSSALLERASADLLRLRKMIHAPGQPPPSKELAGRLKVLEEEVAPYESVKGFPVAAPSGRELPKPASVPCDMDTWANWGGIRPGPSLTDAQLRENADVALGVLGRSCARRIYNIVRKALEAHLPPTP